SEGEEADGLKELVDDLDEEASQDMNPALRVEEPRSAADKATTDELDAAVEDLRRVLEEVDPNDFAADDSAIAAVGESRRENIERLEPQDVGVLRLAIQGHNEENIAKQLKLSVREVQVGVARLTPPEFKVLKLVVESDEEVPSEHKIAKQLGLR